MCDAVKGKSRAVRLEDLTTLLSTAQPCSSPFLGIWISIFSIIFFKGKERKKGREVEFIIGFGYLMSGFLISYDCDIRDFWPLEMLMLQYFKI